MNSMNLALLDRRSLKSSKCGWLSYALGCVLFLVSLSVGAAYTLTVAHGSGSGAYAKATVVHIFADAYENPDATTIEPPQAGVPLRVFDRWTGDTSKIADIYSPNTTLKMPKANVSIAAQYKDAPNGSPPIIWSYFPPNHSGVIFMFHGSGGSAASLVTDNEAAAFIRDASARGLGVVAMDSYNRTMPGAAWNTSSPDSSNVDMQRVAAVRQSLIAAKSMTANDPVYFFGFSIGGIFSSLFTQQVQSDLAFPVAAGALMSSPGEAGAMSVTTVPTIIVTQANDSIVPYAAAAQNFNSLVTRGIPAQLWTNEEIPVYDNLFWGIPGLSSADSKDIHDGLSAAGYLDASGYLLSDPVADTSWLEAVPSQYSSYSSEIAGKLATAYAEHGITANFNKKILDFFASPTTVITQKASISAISPSSGSAGTVVTISGSNFIGVTAVSFNGIPASFTYVSTTTLVAVAPAKVTTGPIQVVSMAGTAVSSPFTVSTAH